MFCNSCIQKQDYTIDTVEHIPLEISRYVYLFMEDYGRRNGGTKTITHITQWRTRNQTEAVFQTHPMVEHRAHISRVRCGLGIEA